MLTGPIAYWKGEFPYPNVFYKRDIEQIFEFVEKYPYYAMKSIDIIYKYNYDRYSGALPQGYKDLMENITEDEIRYMYEMRGNLR